MAGSDSLHPAETGPRAARTIRVRCATWDEASEFYHRKLEHGRGLTIVVPYDAVVGELVAIALELPGGGVLALDGAVAATRPHGPQRWAIDVELHGQARAGVDRLALLVADARARRDEDAADRAGFAGLDGELRRLGGLPAHDVLGVAADATPATVRRARRRFARAAHPDAVAPDGPAAVRRVAEELLLLAGAAARALAGPRATTGAGAVGAPAAWLDLGAADGPVAARAPAPMPTPPSPRRRPTTGTPTVRFGAVAPDVDEFASPGTAGRHAPESPFEVQARGLLATGDAPAAAELLAAALQVYPRNARMRALHHVADAHLERRAGRWEAARDRLQVALGIDPECADARALLADVLRAMEAG